MVRQAISKATGLPIARQWLCVPEARKCPFPYPKPYLGTLRHSFETDRHIAFEEGVVFWDAEACAPPRVDLQLYQIPATK